MRWISRSAYLFLSVSIIAFLFLSGTAHAAVEWSDPIMLNTNGASDSGDDWPLQIIADSGGTLHTVWKSDEDLGSTAGTDDDIFHATNSGTGWSAPSLLNTNGATDSGGDTHPRIIEDSGGTLHAVWRSAENLGGTAGTDGDIFYATNSGTGWSVPALLNTNGASDSGYDSDAWIFEDSGGTLHAAWCSLEDLGGTAGTDDDIFYATNSGTGWSAPSLLNITAASDSGIDHIPVIFEDSGGTLHAAWRSLEDLGGTAGTDGDIFYATNSGTGWSSPEFLNTNAASDSATDNNHRIIIESGGALYAIWWSWEDLGGTAGGSDSDIFYATNSGTGWSTPALLNTNGASDGGDDWNPQIIKDSGGTLHVVWSSIENLGGTADTDFDIFYAANSGTGWSAPSLFNTTAASDSGGDYSPQISVDSADALHVAWYSTEDLGGTAGADIDIFYARSVKTWHVNQAGTEDFIDIQSALSSASVLDGDTIIVRDGTYTGANNKDLDFGGKAITLQSENGPTNCIIDCQGDGRGVYFGSGETSATIFDGFWIRNAGNANAGAGIRCLDSSPTIQNCIITDCDAVPYFGGGISCYDNSSPTIKDCVISHNAAGWGGGISCMGTCSPLITGCTISGNTAQHNDGTGGGIYCYTSSSVTLTNCLITANIAADYGGGVFCFAASATLTNCTVALNAADDGGGVYCNSLASCIIGNSILWGNDGVQGPQLLLAGYSDVTVLYSDFEGGSGDVYVWDATLNWGAGNLYQNPLFENPPDFVDRSTATGTTTTIQVADASMYAVDDVIEIRSDGIARTVTNASIATVTFTPGLSGSSQPWEIVRNFGIGGSVPDDYHLQPCSPAIDAGDPGSLYTNEPEDNRGRINMGAYGNTSEATVGEACANPARLYFQGVTNYGGTSAPELARAGINYGNNRVMAQVKDASTDAQIKQVFFTLNFEPISLAVLPDFTGTSAPELACLGRRESDGCNLADVRDASSGALIKRVYFHAEFLPYDIEWMPNFGQTSAPELVVLARRPSDTAIMGAKRDASSRFLLGPRTWFSATFLPVDIEVMGDISGNAVDELVSLQQRESDDAIISEVRDASTNTLVQRVWYDNSYIYNSLDVEVMSDFGGDTTAPELAMLRYRPDNGEVAVEIHDSLAASSEAIPNPLTTVTFDNAYRPLDIEVVSDFSGGSTAPELVVLGYQASDDAVAGEVRDASTGTLITTVSFDSDYRPKGLEVLPSFGDTSAPELAVHGVNPGDDSVIGEVRDASSGALLQTCTFSKFFVIP